MKLTNEQIYQIIGGAPDWQKCYCTETEQRLPYDNYLNLDNLREILELRERVVALEKLRPHWAKGYTNDSVAAQMCAAALSNLWEALEVKNQTEAIQQIERLQARVVGLEQFKNADNRAENGGGI